MNEQEAKLVSEQRAYVASKQEQFERDLASVLETEPGKRLWLWIVNDLCGLNKEMPVGPNLERTEGRRDVAIGMAQVLQPFPELALGVEVLRATEAAEEFRFMARVNKLNALRRPG